MKCVKCGKIICSYSRTKRCKSCSKLGKKNINWKGNSVGYNSLHIWLNRKYSKPNFCEKCGQKHPYDLSLKEGKKYTRNIKNFEWLCRRCHMKRDGRLKKLADLSSTWIEDGNSYILKPIHRKRGTVWVRGKRKPIQEVAEQQETQESRPVLPVRKRSWAEIFS